MENEKRIVENMRPPPLGGVVDRLFVAVFLIGVVAF